MAPPYSLLTQRFMLRMSPADHRRLRQGAEWRGLSMNQYLRRLLEVDEKRIEGEQVEMAIGVPPSEGVAP